MKSANSDRPAHTIIASTLSRHLVLFIFLKYSQLDVNATPVTVAKYRNTILVSPISFRILSVNTNNSIDMP